MLLLYPPNQTAPGAVCKPNGSLAYPIQLARDHVSYGLDAAKFFIVVPLPGSPCSTWRSLAATSAGTSTPDTMNIYRANMTGTLAPRGRLEELRSRAWDEVNSPAWKDAKKAWAATPS